MASDGFRRDLEHGDWPRISKTDVKADMLQVFERAWTGSHALKPALAGRLKLLVFLVFLVVKKNLSMGQSTDLREELLHVERAPVFHNLVFFNAICARASVRNRPACGSYPLESTQMG